MNPTYIGDIELNEETLAHYGVMGMRWGVRRDLKKTGSISKKTKGKIKKAVSKASYGKTRRMLNALEQTKADYKGDKEYYKSKKQTKNVNSANRSLSEVNKISTDINKTAKSKGYSYNKDQATRMTRRAMGIQRAGGMLGGFLGSAGAGAATLGLDHYYRNKNKTTNSPYWVYDTDVYSKKERKNKEF